MKKFNRLVIVSGIWNFIMLIALLIQSNIILGIIRDKLYPDIGLIKALIDNKADDFVKDQVIALGIFLTVLILTELIIYFSVNTVFLKKFHHLSHTIDTNELKEAKYIKYCYIALISYMTAFILILIGYLIVSGLNLYNISQEIDFNNNKTLETVKKLIMELKLESLFEYKKTIDHIIEEIKANSAIYQLIQETINSLNTLDNIKNAWYYIGYIILGFGIFLNGKVIYKLNKR